MPLYLANKNETPQGGFRYTDPETKMRIDAPSWKELLVNVKKHKLANNLPIGLNIDEEIETQLASVIPHSQTTGDNPNRSAAMPRNEWPLWARTIALLRAPEDKGVGSTIERTIGPTNSENFKKWYHATFGQSCGCSERREKFDAQFPYGA